jgi:uncharacterized membrane protein
MNNRNATGILTEQRPPVTATSHGSKGRLSLLWILIAAIFLTVVQLVTLFVKTPTLAYVFFSIIMIATTAVIASYAWKWHNTEIPA